MKRILSFLLFLTISICAIAQSAQGRYNSIRTQDGMLFFIQPQRLNELSGIKRFEYDMTLLSWQDSVTVNFTFESSQMTIPTDLKIESNGTDIECDTFSALFVDVKKNHFEIRITSKFSLEQIEFILTSVTPPKFCFKQGNEPMSATYSLKAWRKDKKKLNDILNLYKLSR